MQTITLDKAKKGKEISPLLYGIFFEDINYAGDGGLYGELIPNRSFSFYDREGLVNKSHMCWSQLENRCGIVNSGYCNEGFCATTNEEFILRFRAKAEEDTLVLACFIDEKDNDIAVKEIDVKKHGDEKEYVTEITCPTACELLRLALVLPEGGDIEFTYVSLFPKNTFLKRENGMREDLALALKGLKPSFMRFPGGCIVEGRSFENMYNWKDTVGPVHERKVNFNRWQMEEYQQENRDSSDYFQSYGIGFFEYFQLCEDLGAIPLPVINCGMTCQWHEGLLVDMDKLDKFIQDAIDLVEFANGSVDTKWGALRASMGHEKSFELKYLGIGNEQWGNEYFERYEAFEEAFRSKLPDIKLITCAGWNSEGNEFDLAYDWMEKNKDKAYAVDEHFYKSPQWFLDNVHRYDNYDRSLPKVFAGEYASHTAEQISMRKNNLYAALTEAAFLTGVEKNADHVVMTSYAPLFARDNHQQWQPDLIWFNKKECFFTPSYYVQKLFAENRADVDIEIPELLDLEKQGIYACAGLLGQELILKLVNLSGHPVEMGISAANKAEADVWFVNGQLEDENSFDDKNKICIKNERRSLSAFSLNENEFAVVRI